jgi:hypothetical protein
VIYKVDLPSDRVSLAEAARILDVPVSALDPDYGPVRVGKGTYVVRSRVGAERSAVVRSHADAPVRVYR